MLVTLLRNIFLMWNLYFALRKQCLQDEDIYTFFEPELPSDGIGIPRPKPSDMTKPSGDKRSEKNGSKSSQKQTLQRHPENKQIGNIYNNNNSNNVAGNGGRRSSPSPDTITWNVLDLKGDNYFSCTVGRTRTNARYLLPTSDDVVSFLRDLSRAS